MASPARRRKSDLEQTEPFYTKASPLLLAEAPANSNERKPTKGQDTEWSVLFQHCEARSASLVTWRLGHWSTWAQIARYQAPWRYYAFMTANNYQNGLRNDFSIIDRTATLCGEVCAAGLMAGLTDPDRPWLKLGPAIPGFSLDKPGQMFYDDLTERLRYIYDESNFYEAQAQHYTDLTFFGTAPIIDYESAENIFAYRTPCAGEYCLGVGFENNNEVFYEDIRQTISQTVEMFGVENCPEEVLHMWRQKGGALEYENIIGHAIEPNFQIDAANGQTYGFVDGGFAWREVYWLKGKKDCRPLSLTGFHEQPFAVSRWDTQGNDAYGRGVGEKMLGDTVQLQLETRQKAESILKINNPPMGADVTLQNQPASTNPGKITYMNTMTGKEMFWKLLDVDPRVLSPIIEDLREIRERLSQTAYNDIFRMMEDLRDKTRGQVTATEIDALKEERLMRLGPVIGRVYGSLRQRVRRHLAIMKRRDLLPRIPPSLQNVPLKIDFVSMLTQAQRATQTAAIARAFQFAGAISGAFPEARFVLDEQEGTREFTEGLGAPSRIVRSPKQIKQLVQAEQQQKQAAQALAVTKEGAAAAGTLSKTSLAPGSALAALVGGQG